MKRVPYIPDFLEGMNTTADETGMELPFWVLMQNVRFHTGNASRRAGMQRIDRVVNTDVKAMDFNGADDVVTVPLDTRVWTLGKRWTAEVLFKPATESGTQTIQSFGHVTTWPFQFQMVGTTLNVKVTDTGDTVVTLTATVAAGGTYAVQLVRDGTALTLRVNGDSALTKTGTMADLNCKVPATSLLFGNDSAGNFLSGSVDFFRLLNYAAPNQKYGLMRLPDPRLTDLVLADYAFEIAEATTERVDDRSQYGNHGAHSGAGGAGVTNLARQNSPINLIEPWLGDDGKTRIAVIGGEDIHLAEVTA